MVSNTQFLIDWQNYKSKEQGTKLRFTQQNQLSFSNPLRDVPLIPVFPQLSINQRGLQKIEKEAGVYFLSPSLYKHSMSPFVSSSLFKPLPMNTNLFSRSSSFPQGSLAGPKLICSWTP